MPTCELPIDLVYLYVNNLVVLKHLVLLLDFITFKTSDILHLQAHLHLNYITLTNRLQ